MKPTLLVLAAGMGSRYGGLKQMDAFGPNGETILDYSIYDAINAGFGKVVFVIRESFDDAFRAFFKDKFDDKVQVSYVFQDIHDVPTGATFDKNREKPWGTAHAVWVAREEVDEPFVVINADDFYGKQSYEVIVDYFNRSGSGNYALIGYRLNNTLSEHGTVNRGVCTMNDQAQLTSVVETLKIGYNEEGGIEYPTEEGTASLEPDTIVSMNFWGFHPDYFDYCATEFSKFLESEGDKPKSEFFIPLLMEYLIKHDEKRIDVVPCDEEWFGVTYQKDKPFVQERIKSLIDSGVYPERLWGK